MNRDAGSVGVVDAEHLVEGHSGDLELAADLDDRDGERPRGDLQVGRLAVDAEQLGGLGHRVGALAADHGPWAGLQPVWFVIGHGAQLVAQPASVAIQP
jgi:hypothetical protein